MAFTKNYVQKDGTKKIYVSSRQGATYFYITGSGDDLENGVRGQGPLLKIKGTGDEVVTQDIGFIDDVYLKDGVLFWQNAVEGDLLTLSLILPAHTLFPAPEHNGNYDIDADGNLVENDDWTGAYIKVDYDLPLGVFINNIELIGDNTSGLFLDSADTAFISSKLRIRVTLKSESKNDQIVVRFISRLYRDKTI